MSSVNSSSGSVQLFLVAKASSNDFSNDVMQSKSFAIDPLNNVEMRRTASCSFIFFALS